MCATAVGGMLGSGCATRREIDAREAVEAGMRRCSAGATTASATAGFGRWVAARASARRDASRLGVEGTLGVFECWPRVPRVPPFRRVS